MTLRLPYKAIRIGVTVPEEEGLYLKEYASKNGTTVSWLVSQMVKKEVASLKAKENSNTN